MKRAEAVVLIMKSLLKIAGALIVGGFFVYVMVLWIGIISK